MNSRPPRPRSFSIFSALLLFACALFSSACHAFAGGDLRPASTVADLMKHEPGTKAHTTGYAMDASQVFPDFMAYKLTLTGMFDEPERTAETTHIRKFNVVTATYSGIPVNKCLIHSRPGYRLPLTC